MITDSTPPAPTKPPLIQASELSQYGYCHRAWWLGAVKHAPSTHQAALDAGTQTHRRHAEQVRTAFRWRYAGLALLGMGSFVLALTIIFSII